MDCRDFSHSGNDGCTFFSGPSAGGPDSHRATCVATLEAPLGFPVTKVASEAGKRIYAGKVNEGSGFARAECSESQAAKGDIAAFCSFVRWCSRLPRLSQYTRYSVTFRPALIESLICR
jgi:hypothetical protein